MFDNKKIIILGLLLVLFKVQFVNAEESIKYAVLGSGSHNVLACYEIISSGSTERYEHEFGCGKTLNYLENQCSIGDTQSCLGLAGVYYNGLAGQRDKGVYRRLLIEVCEQGLASACRQVWNDGTSPDGYLMSVDKDQATASFINNCDELDGDACAELAMAYAYGLGFDQDIESSILLLNKWCESGSNKACHLMVGFEAPRYIAGGYEEELIDKLSDHCDYQAYAPCARDLIRLFTTVPVATPDEKDQKLNEKIISTELGKLLVEKKYNELIVYMNQQEKDDFSITLHIQSMNSRAANIAKFGALLDELVSQQSKSKWPYLLRASYRLGDSLDIGKSIFGARYRNTMIDDSEASLINSDITKALALEPKSPLANFLAAQVALSQRNEVKFERLIKSSKKSAKQHYWYWQLRLSQIDKRQLAKVNKAFLKAEKRNGNLKKLTRTSVPVINRGAFVTSTRLVADDAWYQARVKEFFQIADWKPACETAKKYGTLYPLSWAATEANIRCDKYLDKVLSFNFKKQPSRPLERLSGRAKHGVFLAKCEPALGNTRPLSGLFFNKGGDFHPCTFPSYQFSVKPEFYDWRLRKLLRDLKIDSRIAASSLPAKHTVTGALYGISPDLTRIGLFITVEVDDKPKRQLEIKWVDTLGGKRASLLSESLASHEILLNKFEMGIDAFTTALADISLDTLKDSERVEVEQLSYTDQIVSARSIGTFVVNETEYIVAEKAQNITVNASRKALITNHILIQRADHSLRYAQHVEFIKALKPTLLKRGTLKSADDEKAQKKKGRERTNAEYLKKFGREQQQRNNQIIRDRLFKDINKH